MQVESPLQTQLLCDLVAWWEQAALVTKLSSRIHSWNLLHVTNSGDNSKQI